MGYVDDTKLLHLASKDRNMSILIFLYFTDLFSDKYVLIGCDLEFLSYVERQLIQCEIQFNCPTLVLSEVAMCYMDASRYGITITSSSGNSWASLVKSGEGEGTRPPLFFTTGYPMSCLQRRLNITSAFLLEGCQPLAIYNLEINHNACHFVFPLKFLKKLVCLFALKSGDSGLRLEKIML